MEYRIERDSMGEMQVPADRYWAAQTQRSYQNFKIGIEKMPTEIVHAFGILKKGAAIANFNLGKLDEERKNIICQAADDVISGKLMSSQVTLLPFDFLSSLIRLDNPSAECF